MELHASGISTRLFAASAIFCALLTIAVNVKNGDVIAAGSVDAFAQHYNPLAAKRGKACWQFSLIGLQAFSLTSFVVQRLFSNDILVLT